MDSIIDEFDPRIQLLLLFGLRILPFLPLILIYHFYKHIIGILLLLFISFFNLF